MLVSTKKMANAHASHILQELARIRAAESERKVNLIAGRLDREIFKLDLRLGSINVEEKEKQIDGRRDSKIWLDKFNDICYEAEDVLDELNTVLLKLKIDESDRNKSSLFERKVCLPFIPRCCSSRLVVKRREIALKVGNINERFDQLRLDEIAIKRNMASRDSTRSGRRGAVTCPSTELSKLHGRDQVKEDVISKLLCETDCVEFKEVISVYGMGGVGKTALAQLIYNDNEIVTHFDMRIWVCVSKVFDLRNIAEEIILHLHPSLSRDDLHPIRDLPPLLESLQGRKIFLVLDDVWKCRRDDWNLLQALLRRAAVGSRILVTTRDYGVAAGMMRTSSTFYLKQLTQEVCWLILSQEAFIGRGEEECESLKDIGWKIAEKSKGLPLAAKTLGCLLRFKRTREEWVNILYSEIWELDLVQKCVFASYSDLPSALKPCFLYCCFWYRSILPQGGQIDEDDLICQWMAQGYLSPGPFREMEDNGSLYHEWLLLRSFFEDLEFENGSIRACKMPAIMLDFARYLMGNEFVLKDLEDNSSVVLLSGKTRHLLLRLTKKTGFPKLLLRAEKLWSLTFLKIDDEEEEEEEDDESSQNLSNLFIQAKRLRSLVFFGCNINGLPKEVGKLMHLRLLNLSGSKLKILPDTICELCNLQTLNLGRCYYLEKLPDRMEKLVNLRYLDITDCAALTYSPKVIGKLTSLRKLLGIVVRCDRNDNNEFSLGDLEKLRHLHVLRLTMVGDKIDADEARRAKLGSKAHLKELELDDWLLKDMKRDDIIEALKPLPLLTNVRFEPTSPKLRKNGRHT